MHIFLNFEMALKRKKQGIADDTNTLAFRDNRIRNNVCRVVTPKILPNSTYSSGDLVFDCRRSKRELIQEIMFVNMCVKFRDNWIRNKKICQIRLLT